MSKFSPRFWLSVSCYDLSIRVNVLGTLAFVPATWGTNFPYYFFLTTALSKTSLNLSRSIGIAFGSSTSYLSIQSITLFKSDENVCNITRSNLSTTDFWLNQLLLQMMLY